MEATSAATSKGGSAQAIEVLKQILNRRHREIPYDRPQDFDRTRQIPGERVGDTRPAGKLGGAVREHLRRGIGTRKGDQDIGQRLREQDRRCFFTNGWIGVRGQDSQEFDALFRREPSPQPS